MRRKGEIISMMPNRKDGKIVYYSLDDEHVKEIYEKGREHIEEA